MCGDCFVCIYLVCQCDGLELGRRNRRITVRGVAVRINKGVGDIFDAGDGGCHVCGVAPCWTKSICWVLGRLMCGRGAVEMMLRARVGGDVVVAVVV